MEDEIDGAVAVALTLWWVGILSGAPPLLAAVAVCSLVVGLYLSCWGLSTLWRYWSEY